LVKYVAGRVGSRMPAHVELADLISYGLGGLIDAVERFEPVRGIKFESYASVRIRGAIFDEMRARDWVPRAVRLEARQINQATSELASRLQRLPTDAELATELSMDAQELDQSLQRVANAQVSALDEPRGVVRADGLQHTLLDTLADADAIDPAVNADAMALRDRIATAMKELPAREQLVLGLRYHQELTNDEIGEVISASGSRVSQLHAKAVLQLAALLPLDRTAPSS
jgi:RNA polymerase sigma factor for flagellar operon FliA